MDVKQIKDKFIEACIWNDLLMIINIFEEYPDFDPNCIFEHIEQFKILYKITNSFEIVKLLLENDKFDINKCEDDPNYKISLLNTLFTTHNPFTSRYVKRNIDEIIKTTILILESSKLKYIEGLTMTSACNYSNYNLVNLLLKSNIPIRIREPEKGEWIWYVEALNQCIKNNNIDIILLLLEDSRVIDPSYAIYTTCSFGNIEILKLLWNYPNPHLQKNINDFEFYQGIVHNAGNTLEIAKFVCENMNCNFDKSKLYTLLFYGYFYNFDDGTMIIPNYILDNYINELDFNFVINYPKFPYISLTSSDYVTQIYQRIICSYDILIRLCSGYENDNKIQILSKLVKNTNIHIDCTTNKSYHNPIYRAIDNGCTTCLKILIASPNVIIDDELQKHIDDYFKKNEK